MNSTVPKPLPAGRAVRRCLTCIIRGSDAYGNPVETAANLDATVSAALPSDSYRLRGIEVELPTSPYYAGAPGPERPGRAGTGHRQRNYHR
ncbi:MAG: hypothetical protein U5P10_08315 [Spirochaetia bacterium]|nr:hypothetical protein [Spirochaetia bacterium]